MASAKDPTCTTPPPAPIIGKIGPYTVFRTPPPSSPKPPTSTASTSPSSPAPASVAVSIPESPKKPIVHPKPPPSPVAAPPPVRPPPVQFDKPAASYDRLEFFRNAVAKVQEAHSSVDDFMANWLGLNQSKYQWALDDYYEAKGMEKGDAKVKEISNKSQCV